VVASRVAAVAGVAGDAVAGGGAAKFKRARARGLDPNPLSNPNPLILAKKPSNA
jgi:hypothetical protein